MADPVLVLHFTQGTTIAGAVAAMQAARSQCHEVIDPATETTMSLLPWTGPARSLKHPAGMPDTNNRGWHAGTGYGRCYQVEIVGYSERAANYSDEWYTSLGQYLRTKCMALGVPYVFPHQFVANGYGVNAGQRLTWAQWATVTGIVGHQHVPGNDHWDPGALDIARLTRYMETYTTMPTTDPVKASQQRLNDSGAKPPLVIDGVWGPACDAALDAVLKFQQGQMADLKGQLQNVVADREEVRRLGARLLVERNTAETALADAVANREAAEAEAAMLRKQIQAGGRLPQLLADVAVARDQLTEALAKGRA